MPPRRLFKTEWQSRFLRGNKVSPVDRDLQERALSEAQLGLAGVIDRETAPKIGKMTGAKKSVQIQVNSANLSTRVVDLETLKVEYSDLRPLTQSSEAFLRLESHFEHYLLLQNVSALKPRKQEFTVTLSSPKKRFRKNETIQFEVNSSESAYVYLVLLQNNGEVFLLYPNEDSPSAWVDKNKTIAIPEKSSGYQFVASEPFGTDLVKVIASKKPLNLFPVQPVPGSPFSEAKTNSPGVRKGIKKVATGLVPGEWSADELWIETSE